MSFFGKKFKSSQQRPIDETIQNALRQMHIGNFKESLQSLEAKKDDPGLVQNEMKELLLGLTECYFKRLLNLRGLEIARSALPLCKQLGDLFGIGFCYYYLSKHRETIEFLSQAMTTTAVKQNAWKHGKSLIILGHSYYTTRQQTEALSCYRQAIQICRENKDRVGEAEGHLWLGMLIAQPFLQSSIRTAKTQVRLPVMSNDLYASDTFLLLSLAGKRQILPGGEAAEAYTNLKAAVDLVEQTGDYLTLGFSYRTLGWLDVAHGNQRQGSEQVLKAAENFSKLDNTFFAGTSYFALGLVARDVFKELKLAADFFAKAAEGAEGAESLSPLNIGNSYLQWAHCAFNLGQFGKAQQGYENALTWLEKETGSGALDSLGPAELNPIPLNEIL